MLNLSLLGVIEVFDGEAYWAVISGLAAVAFMGICIRAMLHGKRDKRLLLGVYVVFLGAALIELINGRMNFLLWFGGRKNRSEIEFALNKVASQLHLIKHPDGSGFVTASMGVAICPEYGEDYHKLFMHADDALYTAKKEGRDCYVFCS